MLKVEMRYAKPGMTLALPVTHPERPQHILLRVGYVLDREVIQRLSELNLRFLWVRCPGLEFLSEFIDPQLLQTQAQVYQQITDTFSQLQNQSSAQLPYNIYCKSIGTMVQQLVNNPKAALFLDDLANPLLNDGDLLRHSSSVTYLSLLMGLKLEGYLIKQRKHIDPVRAKEVINLGLGAMLHDVGVLRLPPEVRRRQFHKPDEDDPSWREHPILGYRMVRQEIEPSAATVVLNHHQRYDGTGYAGQDVPLLDRDRIHVFARIVGLAEQFDRMRHQIGCPPRSAVEVLGRLIQPDLSAKFDPQVLSALLTVVPPYPPGSMLRLSDGRWAVSVQHHPLDPCSPTVQVIPEPHPSIIGTSEAGEMLNLSSCSSKVTVVECDGIKTSGFNFARPDIMQYTFHAVA